MVNNAEIYLSIIIPAYNEARRLPQSLRDIKTFFSRFPENYEVIVIVEKSSDNTVQLAQAEVAGDLHFKIVDNKVRRGKGFAVRTGMLMAQGKYQFFMDADLSTPLSEVISFLAELESHQDIDILIGNRKHPKTNLIKKQNPLRQKMGETFNHFVQSFAFGGIQDTQCGFKAFKKDVSRNIFSRQTLNGFSFDVEVLLLARQMNYKIKDLPVKWINSPDSKVHVIKDSFKMLWDIMKVKRLVRRSLQTKPFLLQKSEQ